MNFSLLKFFEGFNVFNPEKLAKLVFYGILITLGLVLYHNLTKDTTHNDIKADIADSVQNPKFTTFGCANIKVQEKK